PSAALEPGAASRAARHARTRARSSLTRGWGTATLRAVVAVAGTAVLAEGLAFLADSASGSRRPPASLAARIGGVAFLWFHHVGLVFGSTGGEASFRLTLALALLGGTAVAVWLLAL